VTSLALPLRRVGIVLRDSSDAETIKQARAAFEQRGAAVELIHESEAPTPGGHVPAPAPEAAFDLMIALGGDGTVLRAFHAHPGVPILGINFGTLGFLTACDAAEMEKAVENIYSGQSFLEERLVLQSIHRGVLRLVLNELVIKGVTRMADVDVTIDESFVHTFRGDGVIIGTPTGSTSYLMSTGSPILMPRTDCFVLNGINEHRFSARSIVIRGSSAVRLRLNPSSREHQVFLCHDGRDKIELAPGEDIDVRRAQQPARLVFFERNYFFKNLKSRLNW